MRSKGSAFFPKNKPKIQNNSTFQKVELFKWHCHFALLLARVSDRIRSALTVCLRPCVEISDRDCCPAFGFPVNRDHSTELDLFHFISSMISACCLVKH